MGSATSASSHSSYVGRSTQEVVMLMMPVYYTEDPVTEVDIAIAKTKWEMVLDDTANGFVTNKGKEGFDYTSCMIMFYDSFYQRLFDVHPMCKSLFTGGLKSQGKFLVKMISLSISLLDNDEQFQRTLVKLTEAHNTRGVKSIEYGIVGEVLFWSLRRCLGVGYDAPTHTSWVKIFSRMLKVMVPVAVVFEMKSGEAQIKRLADAAAGAASAETSAQESPRADGASELTV